MLSPQIPASGFRDRLVDMVNVLVIGDRPQTLAFLKYSFAFGWLIGIF